MAETQSADESLELAPTAQFAFALPTSADIRMHMHLTIHSHSVVLFVSNSTMGSTAAASCGSLVYSLPNLRDPSAQPLATALYQRAGSVDFMTRLARVLAKKMRRPVYVGGDVNFWSQEDEGAALKGVLECVKKVLMGS